MEPKRLFKRKIYDRLLKWKQESNGKSALLIEGARRIGKSTIVQTFARNEYESFILIDFTKCSQEIKNLFNDVSDLNYIFLRLQLVYGVQLSNASPSSSLTRFNSNHLPARLLSRLWKIIVTIISKPAR